MKITKLETFSNEFVGFVRVTADNGSMMTGPGTNAYFIGAPGSDSWALLDPGPDDDAHVKALLAAAPGKITRILCTHTHKDHSPAAAAIAAATGAPVLPLGVALIIQHGAMIDA